MFRTIGEPLFGPTTPAIVSACPQAGILVTLPLIHTDQRLAYIDRLKEERHREGLPPFTEKEEEDLLFSFVDLYVKGDTVLIRPDPMHIGLAFAADAMLQEELPRHRIKFILTTPAVRNAITHRGEAWRIQPLPRSLAEIIQLIENARASAGGKAIYFYSAIRGSRILTCESFRELRHFSDEDLRSHLLEIQALAGQNNMLRWPELVLFACEDRLKPEELLTQDNLANIPPEMLRNLHADACARFAAAAPVKFHQDDLASATWRNLMYRELIPPVNDTIADEDLVGLGEEYFMQIRWISGARGEHDELIADTADTEAKPSDRIGHELACNIICEYGGIEYLNIGQVVRSLSRRVETDGRREVYVVQFRPRGAKSDELHIIRFQKWGVRERLDQGRSLLQAMCESEDYTDYIFARRLSCQQLGMRLPGRIWTGRVQEIYQGTQKEYHGKVIWSSYFQREYVHGIASDKVPRVRLSDPDYALQLAIALGRAAAVNLIVGRANDKGKVVFDDGDEVLVEDSTGHIRECVISDPTGAFANFQTNLLHDARSYAAPITSRAKYLSDVASFTEGYLSAFAARFRQAQNAYRRHRHSYDALFSHRHRDPGGNQAHRWATALARMESADVDALVRVIREQAR